MSKTRSRRMHCLYMLTLLLGLLVVAGCSQSTPPALSPSEATPNTTSRPQRQEERDRDPDNTCCLNDSVAGTPQKQTPPIKEEPLPGGVTIPNVVLVNQDGERVQFHDDLVRGKIVAVNFIFTTCKGICPPMSANFAKLQERLGDRVGNGVELISVSVDPQVDTPQRLKAWRESFGGRRGWTLLTGQKQDVDFLMKELGVFSADKNNHSQFIFLGDERAGKWTRVNGLTACERLANLIVEMHDASRAAEKSPSIPTYKGNPDRRSIALPVTAEPSSAEKYFTNVELVNQHGKSLKLYDDLLRGKVVVINSFFSTCKGSCPVMLSSFAKIQKHFADRVGKDLFLISISVDPQIDTPNVLSAFAEQWRPMPGWTFLTGDKANVDTALGKLWPKIEDKESHSNIFLIGNEATGLWKKARGLSKPEDLIPLIEEALKDKS